MRHLSDIHPHLNQIPAAAGKVSLWTLFQTWEPCFLHVFQSRVAWLADADHLSFKSIKPVSRTEDSWWRREILQSETCFSRDPADICSF